METEHSSSDFKGNKLLEFAVAASVRALEPDGEFIKEYTLSYNGCLTARSFIGQLKQHSRKFQRALLTLPVDYPEPESRRILVECLYKYLLGINELLEAKKEVFLKKFPYVSKIPELNEKDIFPREFSEEKHPTIQDYEHHKIHYIHFYHQYEINNILGLLSNYADIEGINLKIGLKGTSRPEILIQKFKTQYSVEVLGCFFGVIADVLSTDMDAINRTKLADYLAVLFQTARTLNPSAKQVHKAIYDYTEKTREVAKGLVIKMMNMLNKR